MTEAGQQRGVATHAWRLWTPEEAIEAVKDLVAAGLKKAGLRMCCERAAGLVEVLATEMDVFLAVRRRLWRAEARDICDLLWCSNANLLLNTMTPHRMLYQQPLARPLRSQRDYPKSCRLDLTSLKWCNLTNHLRDLSSTLCFLYSNCSQILLSHLCIFPD
jgi:hypothetical protein